MLWATAGLVACGGLSVACSSQEQPQQVTVQIPTSNGVQPLTFDMASCPRIPQSTEMDRACMIDRNGKTYSEDGTLWVFPADPPYAVVYQFKPGYTPALQDLDTGGDNPSIGAFAAPYVITGQRSQDPCCAEDNLANRIPSEMTFTPSGALLVVVVDKQPFGDQMAFTLSYGGLFKSRLDPCTLPSAQFCQVAGMSGFAMRFYVGSNPGATQQPPPPDAGPPPTGACLLAYNDALVAAGADSCCYRQGGANNCHAITQCNDAAGAGCCLVYGTGNTAGGDRCCLYESGDFGDDPSECQTLLAAP